MEKFTAHMVHTLELSQFVPADPGRVWEFFSNPRNLRDLTPPKMDFRILGDPGPMYAGQMIAYRIRVAPGVRVGWLTEILHVTVPLTIVIYLKPPWKGDEQVSHVRRTNDVCG
jgi:hypothetical protein